MIREKDIVSSEPIKRNGRNVTEYIIRCEVCGKEFKCFGISKNRLPLCTNCKREREQRKIKERSKDVIHIVRCRNCRFCTGRVMEESGYLLCEKNGWRPPDWWCADGKRKEVAE